MFKVPSAHWSDSEKLKWSIDVSKQLRWSEFNMPAFVIPAFIADVTATAAADDVRLNGLRVGMPIFVTPNPSIDPNIIVCGAWVSVDNTLTMRIVTVLGGPINEPSRTWSYFGVTL